VNLLRFRPTTCTVQLTLPDGSSRPVKVTTNDAGDTQHVEDWEGRVHGTARPAPVVMRLRQPSKQRKGLLLRNMGLPKMRQAWKPNEDTGLWAPVHGSEVAR
jgi:hypothetical protein